MSTVLATVCLAANLFSCAPAEVRVVDGDTISLGREKIRIVGIDAPEMKGACTNEIVLARAAKAKLAELLGGRTIVIAREGRDRYRRTLARVEADGRDVGKVLMAEGLARKWVKNWRPGLDDVWCPR